MVLLRATPRCYIKITGSNHAKEQPEMSAIDVFTPHSVAADLLPRGVDATRRSSPTSMGCVRADGAKAVAVCVDSIIHLLHESRISKDARSPQCAGCREVVHGEERGRAWAVLCRCFSSPDERDVMRRGRRLQGETGGTGCHTEKKGQSENGVAGKKSES